MSWIERLHAGWIAGRRVTILSALLAPLVPTRARILDVGCGDGRLAATLARLRPDVTVHGVDVLVRPDAAIPVDGFDGDRIPAGDGSVDVVLLVDVLHHAEDPEALLREAARVAPVVLVKDHLREGWLAGPTLRFMDGVGNRRFGVALPHHYWRRQEWAAAFRRIGLSVQDWNEEVPLYPFPASLLFGRSLHFVARLEQGVGRTRP